MKLMRRRLLLLVGSAGVTALLVVTISQARDESPARFVDLANRGTLFDTSALGPRSRSLLSSHTDGQLRRLGARDAYTFYVADSPTGKPCVVGGIQRGLRPEIAVISCPEDPPFPSEEQPIYDLSTFGAADYDTIYVTRMAGLAADGIAEVAVIGADGTRYPAPVNNNIYYLSSLPKQPITAMVAVDTSGNEVLRRSLPPR